MYDGPIIDVDVHHRWHSEDDLISYLEPEWRDVVERPRSAVALEAPVALFHHTTGSNKRPDTFPDTGGPPGSSYEQMRDQYLNAFPVERVVLSFDIGTSGGVANPYLASALCRAANDWCLDRWIDQHKDPRLYTGLLVPTQLPEDGAREIRRLGDHPRIVEALVVSNALGRPFGHPVYHPIYEAANEFELPIAVHGGGDQWSTNTHFTAGGMPNSRFEFHTSSPMSAMLHIASFITHGVFEKFPKLKLVMIEIGTTWIPWLLWNLDKSVDLLRRESPWVKRLPSEYFFDHIRLSSQPLELSPDKRQLVELLESAGPVDEVIVFASDYPHWDTDDPSYVARRLPESWQRKVLYENCLHTLRWPSDALRLDELSPAAASVT